MLKVPIETCVLHRTTLPKQAVPVTLIEHPMISDSTPKAYRFLAQVLDELVQTKPPDLFHGNDWFASWSIELLSKRHIPTLLTIHNPSYWPEELRRGIRCATKINTVSPSYAREILLEPTAFGLSEALNGRKNDLSGILNGIDTGGWNPAADTMLRTRYGSSNWKQGKRDNKLELCQRTGLDEKRPLFAFIGRLDSRQKGIGKMLEILSYILKEASLVVLGTGADDLEKRLAEAEKDYPRYLRSVLRFDEPFAHLLYAAADAILLPSVFEPCGLVQMIAQRYGTIPIAHAVGGLKDTIRNNETGFLYQENTSQALLRTIEEALHLLESDRWDAIVDAAMHQDFSWEKSARLYERLYKNVLRVLMT